MTYQGTLDAGQEILIENDGEQTQITLFSGGASQQQSQGSGFTTGAWSQPPALLKTRQGVILQIEASRGLFHFLIAGSGLRVLSEAPPLRDAEALPLQESTRPAFQPMKPMEPMAPTKPMEPMKPMELRMGNMQMSMGGTAPATAASSAAPASSATPEATPKEHKRFCTQCGREAGENDRFCGRCGHELHPAS